MAFLNTAKGSLNKLYDLGGIFPQTPIFVLSWKELKDKKIKETTKSFTEPLFEFLQSEKCVIVNKEEIIIFLENNIDIIDYLYEAPAVIREKFGDVKLNLELYFDPEIEGDKGELFLNIETDFNVKKTREKLKEIDKEWLLSRVGEDIGKFNLNIEFI